jgi:uncharacterized protein (TIGR03067 family)
MRRYVSTGIVSVTLIVGLIAAWSQAGVTASDRDAKLLEGEWMVVGMEDDATTASAKDVKGMKWSFKGTEITASDPDGTTTKMSFTVEPGKKPKEIDVTCLDGPFKGKVLLGIYELDEGHLRVCLPDPTAKKSRPTEFTTT